MKNITFIILCFLFTTRTFAEGSKQFMVIPADSTNPCALNVFQNTSGTGSVMNCPESKRIYIHITNPATEKIDVGFKSGVTNSFFRIFDPNGNIFVPGTQIPATGNTAGRIQNNINNIVGPSNTVVTGGYTPLVYTPTIAGDYWIEFNRDNNFVNQILTPWSLTLWDITVVNTNTAPFTPINGRVYCKNWNLFTGNTGEMKAVTYAYTKDSIIYDIDFNGMAGVNFALSMNSFGVTNTGSVANNRKSITGDASVNDTIGEYKLFFNLPDTNYFQLTQTPLSINFAPTVITGCNIPSQNISQCIQVISTKNATVDLFINLNGIAGYQTGTADVLIPYNVVPGLNCLPWNGKNGLGQYVPTGIPLVISVTIQLGITHIPLYDVEDNPNGFIVNCLLPASIANTPNLYYDDSNLGAGTNFNGCPSPCHTWANNVGNNNTINTWFFGTYISESTTIPTVSYAPQFSLTKVNPNCANNLGDGSITYSALSPYAFQPTDSIGIFQAPLTAPTSYSLASAPFTFNNLAAGTYTVVMKNAQGCSFTQTITLTAIGVPDIAVVGPDQTICAPISNVTLSGNIPTIGTGGWSQFSGPVQAVFADTTVHNTQVTGLLPGTYVFQWTIRSGTCTPSQDQVTIIVYPQQIPPILTSNAPICVGNAINLFADAAVGSTFLWTGPNGFSDTTQNPVLINASTLMTGTYSVTATVGNCIAFSSTIDIVVNALPATPIASGNSPICAGNTINLSTAFAATSSYNWIGPNGFISALQNPNINNATTAMSGNYILTVTNNNTACTSNADTVAVLVNPTPTIPTITNNAPLCVGATLNLTSSSSPTASYNWTGPAGFTSSIQNPSITNVQLNQAGTYSVIATLGNCPSAPVSAVILVNPLPNIPIALSNSPVCVGDTISLNTPSQPGFTYLWNGPGAYNSTLQNPIRPNATVGMAGNYVLQVTNTTTTCKSLGDTINIIVNPLPVTPVLSSNSPICSGDTILLNTTAVGGLTYLWSGPNSFTSTLQNPILTPATLNMTGVYNLKVTDTLTGCTSLSGNTNVLVKLTPTQPTLSSNSPVCEGQTLNFQSTSNAGTTFNWTGPNGYNANTQNPSINNVSIAATGSYNVIATLQGCPSTIATINVEINPLPTTPIGTSNAPICAGNSLVFNTSSINVGYLWTGPNGFIDTLQNPTITNVSTNMSGNYFLTVENNITGCVSLADTISVLINTTPSLPAVTSNSPLCSGTNLNLNSSSNLGAIFIWTSPDGAIDTIQSLNISNVSLNDSGLYQVIAVLGNCPSDTGAIVVVVNPLPATPIITNNSPICAGDSLKLFTTNSPGFSYIWNGPDLFNSVLQNPFIEAATTANSGNYSLSIKDSITSCISLLATANFIVNPLPQTPIATSNSALCVGDTMKLYANNIPNVNYVWTGPLGFNSTSQNPVAANSQIPWTGDYIVHVTDSITGCKSAPDSTFVISNVMPIVFPLFNNGPVCEESALNFDVIFVLGVTYHWSGPNGYTSNNQNPVISPVALADSGTYYMYGTIGTCTSATFSTNANVNPLPPTPLVTSNLASCEGDTILLNANSIIGVNYTWTGPNSFTSTQQNISLLNATIANSGNYILAVTDTNTGCTSHSDTAIVNINFLPIINSVSSNSPVCSGNSINLSAITSNNTNVSWEGPNSYSSSTLNPVINNAQTNMSGTYILSVTDIVTGCTSSSSSTLVQVNQTPATPNLSSNSPVCLGATLNLTALSDVGANYTWSGPNGYNSTLQNPSIISNSSAQSGSYSVFSSLLGCNSTASSIDIVVNNLPATPVLSSNSPLCFGNTLNINSNAPTGVSFNWNGPNAFTSNQSVININNATPALNGDYILNVSDLLTGCTSSNTSITIVVNAVPDTPELEVTKQLCYGDTLDLFTNNVANTYLWTGPNGFSSDIQNPTITNFSDNTVGVYTLTITNSFGCTAEDTIIVVLDCQDISDIFVPNVFTPNGDAENQTFKVITADLKQVEVMIYDRWGILIYSWSNLNGSWDGTNKNGNECSAGTYYYIVNATSWLGKNISKKGSLSLYR
jgi:gliding motility-associated-like protein